MAAIGITACSKSQAPDPENSQAEEHMAETATTYHISIPATMSEDDGTKAMSFDNSGATPTSTSTFSTTEKVYVYNKSQSVMLGSYLTPSNLSNDDMNCDLIGDLTGTIDENDQLWLLYNSDNGGRFYYSGQNGLASGVKDGAKAIVTVSTTSPLTTTDAHFTNLQSVFRFKFADGETPIAISYLIIFTANKHLCETYYGTTSAYGLGRIYVRPTPAISDYLYLGISFYMGQTSNDKMIFIASDGTNLYRTTKAEPAGGFRHGKYYYNTAPIQMTNAGALQTPDITWTTPSSPVTPTTSNSNFHYSINTANADISLTGTSRGYYFYFSDDASVHLNSLTATRFEEAIIRYAKNLTLDITGTNNFSCIDTDRCVYATQTLKLKGNGTLTVTSNSASSCGLFGSSNYTSSNNSYSTTTELDVSTQLAADGYTVTRSARTDNGDGTYTWTYTVEPIKSLSEATTADYGKVVCSAGHLHKAKTAVPEGCTAVGILGEVTETGHGLILALQDATSQTWNTINGWASVTTYAGTTLKLLPDDAARGSLTSYTTLGSTTVSDWAVAQESDYVAIFTNLGSTNGTPRTYDNKVNAYLTTGVGGAALSGYYWSASLHESDHYWADYFRSDCWTFNAKTNSYSVRPVLGF